MNTEISSIKDLKDSLFSPKRFYEQRFLQLSGKRIFFLSFIAVTLGLVLHSLVNMYLFMVVKVGMAGDLAPYEPVLKNLGLSSSAFLDLIDLQNAYSCLTVILSPLIAYMAPHIFGGALFFFLWLLTKPKIKLDFFAVMHCAAISLTSMFFFIVPAIGPVLAMAFVFSNVSRALTIRYELVGPLKIVAIVSAMYVSFMLPSATLQLLAKPLMETLGL